MQDELLDEDEPIDDVDDEEKPDSGGMLPTDQIAQQTRPQPRDQENEGTEEAVEELTDTGKKMKQAMKKSQEKRFKAAEEFSDALVDKLGDKVMCVAVYGSVPEGNHSHESDIDTFVVLDDTKLQRDVPKDAKKKIRRKIIQLAKDMDDRITIQYFSFLTEFWQSLRDGDPLLVTVLRIGEPVYDKGIFRAGKRLVQRGKIKSTRESVMKRLKMGSRSYKTAEKMLTHKIPFRLEQAMAAAGQAPVMMSGAAPPGKHDVDKVLRDRFVEKDMLDDKYVSIAQDLQDFADRAEKDKGEITGAMVDEHLEKADDFIERMHKLVGEIGAKRKVSDIMRDYKMFLKANVAALKAEDVEPPEDREELPGTVREHIDLSEEEEELFDRWETVLAKMKAKELDDVDEKELYTLKNDTREFVSRIRSDLKEEKGSANLQGKQLQSSLAPDKDLVGNVAKAAADKNSDATSTDNEPTDADTEPEDNEEADTQ